MGVAWWARRKIGQGKAGQGREYKCRGIIDMLYQTCLPWNPGCMSMSCTRAIAITMVWSALFASLLVWSCLYGIGPR